MKLTDVLFVTACVRGPHLPVVRFREREPSANRPGLATPCRKDCPPAHRDRHGLRPISDPLDYNLPCTSSLDFYALVGRFARGMKPGVSIRQSAVSYRDKLPKRREYYRGETGRENGFSSQVVFITVTIRRKFVGESYPIFSFT